MNRGSRRINSLGLESSIEILFALWQKEIHQLRLQIKFSSQRQSLRNHPFHLWSIYLYSTKCLQVLLLELWVFVKACSVLKWSLFPLLCLQPYFIIQTSYLCMKRLRWKHLRKEILTIENHSLFCLCLINLPSPRAQWTSC